MLAIFTSPGVWALHLWSNGTLCCNFYILESIWITHSACSSLPWKFSFIGTAAFLQCSGMMLEVCAQTLGTLTLQIYEPWKVTTVLIATHILYQNDISEGSF